MATVAGYGRWDSPLAAEDVARAKVSLSDLRSDGWALYWLESRPAEAGRVVLVRAGQEGRRDHSPAGVSIRSRVHEYGGGAMCLVPARSEGAFAYVDQADQRIWFCDGRAAPGEGRDKDATAIALTPAPPEGEGHRHGGLVATADGEWILAVREVLTPGAPSARSVVAVSTRGDGTPVSVLLDDHDFFGAPCVDQDVTRLAVVAWDYPDMPWDASTLWVVPLGRATGRATDGRTTDGRTTDGRATDGRTGPSLVAAGPAWTVAGGPHESVGQPAWRHDGSLRFVSDRRGWWQPYVHPGDDATEATPVPLTDVAAEWHGADWVLGQSTMAELADGSLMARMTMLGTDRLVRLATASAATPPAGASTAPESAFPAVEQPCVSIVAVCAHGEGVALIGATPDAATAVWVWTPTEGVRAVRPAAKVPLGPGDVATGEAFTLTGRSGRPVHGVLYRPALRGTRAPDERPPPLLVWCHGGPTSNCPAGLDLTVQFFTSRGFAVACVDYAGSTGYGRDYRCALWGGWGVADAEDCLDAALHLGARGAVDARQLAVRGSSAGGMTALNALAAGEGFAACASWYGVTDLMALVATTHDFESRYTDRLIGPLPAARHLYEERSPVRRARAMKGAVLLLQGTEDAVVPRGQAESMRAALDAAGTPCDLRFFEGEGHGFRRADTLVICLETELAFYLDRFGL